MQQSGRVTCRQVLDQKLRKEQNLFPVGVSAAGAFKQKGEIVVIKDVVSVEICRNLFCFSLAANGASAGL